MHMLTLGVFLWIGLVSVSPLGANNQGWTYLPPTQVTAPFQPTAPLPTFTYEWTKQ